MSLLAASKIIFRRIRGRLIPIRVKSVDQGGITNIQIKAGRPTRAKMSISARRSSKTGHVSQVLTVSDYQRMGLSTRMFKRAMIEANKRGINILKGDIRHPAQIKVRSKFKSRFSIMKAGKGMTRISSGQATWVVSGLQRFGHGKSVTAITSTRGAAARDRAKKIALVGAGGAATGF